MIPAVVRTPRTADRKSAPSMIRSDSGRRLVRTMGGAVKVVTIKGRKALLQMQGDKSGSLTIVLGSPNSALKLEGHGTAKADLEALAGAFDLDALEKVVAE